MEPGTIAQNGITWMLVLQLVIPAVAAVLAGGGFAAYMQYLSNKPVNIAKAKNESVAAEISVGEAWQRYADSIRVQYDATQKQYERMRDMYDELEDKHKEVLRLKDKEILELKDHIIRLQAELFRYQSVGNGNGNGPMTGPGVDKKTL